MSKFQRSWQLFKTSMSVLGSNPKLLLFPVVTTIMVCIIALFFLTPLVFWNTGHGIMDADHWKTLGGYFFTMNTDSEDIAFNPIGYLVVVVIYFCSVFLATFFNVAFFNEILNALNGRSVSVIGGLTFATTRLKAILLWSLFTGVIGLIIKTLEERVGLIGRLVLRFIGIAWSVACIFVVPAIVREEKHSNPVLFLRNSAATLKKTWGESLIGYLGIQFGSLLVFLVSMFLLAGGVILSVAVNNFWILAMVAGLWFVGIMVFVFVSGVASQVYKGALFIYATEGVTPDPFIPEQMAMAWKVKSAKKKEL